VDTQKDRPAGQEMDQLAADVGQVCSAASMLDWALIYVTGVIERWPSLCQHLQPR
jgi:hypothetical protein